MSRNVLHPKSISNLVSRSMMNIIIVVLCVAAFISCFIEYIAVSNSARNALEVESKIAAERIEWALKSYTNIVEDIGTIPELSDDAVSIEDKEAILRNKCEEYGLIRSKIINLDGYSDMDNEYRGDREYFNDVKNGKTVFADPVIARTDGALTLIAAAPLWEKGVYGGIIKGVIFISIDPVLLSDILNAMDITKNSEAYVIGDDGTVVASTIFDDVLNEVNHLSLAENDKSYENIAKIDREAIEGQNRVVRTNLGARRQMFAMQDIYGTSGWHLVIRVPMYDIMGGFRLSVLIWLITLPLIWYIIRLRSISIAEQIGNPFREIAERLQRAAEGDLSSEVLVFGDTEETRIISNAARNLVGRLEYMVMDEDEFKSTATLEDLIDVQTLKSMQEMVTVTTGLRTTIMSSDGLRVTSPIGNTFFCDRLTRSTPEGVARCDKCDRDGAYLAIDKGHCVSYNCHAGLKVYAVPIMLDGHPLGAVLAGRIRDKETLDEEMLTTIAEEIGIDKKEYIRAAAQIEVCDEEGEGRIQDILNSTSRLLSTMAHNEYLQRMKIRKQTKRARYLTNTVSADVSDDGSADGTPKNIATIMAEFANETNPLGLINPDANNTFRDVHGFSLDDDTGIMENIYNVRDLINSATVNMDFRLKGRDVDFVLDIDKHLPEKLLGDDRKVARIISRILKCAAVFTKKGYIRMDVSFVRNVYTFYLKIKVRYSGGSSDEVLPENMRSFFESRNTYSLNRHNANELDIINLSTLIRELNGSVDIKENSGEGTTFCVAIPQLEFKE